MIGRKFGQQKIKTVAYAMAAAIITMSSTLWCDGVSAAETPSLPMATSTSSVTSGQEFFAGASYVGSESCKSCHEKAYTNWKQSWHSRANRPVNPDIVVADFNDVELKFTKPKKLMDEKGKGIKDKVTVTMRLHRDKDKFLFTIIDDKDPANNQTHAVALVRGGNWEQHFYAKVGDNLFATPMRWVVEDKAWRKKGYNPGYWWVYKDGHAIPRTPEQFNSINYRSVAVKCAGCHQLGFKPKYDKEKGLWGGESVEYGVSCEHCHGPGSLHNQAAADAEKSGAKLSEAKIINPLTDLSSLQQVQVCGACHIRGDNSASLKKDGKTKSFSYQQGLLPGDQDLHSRFTPWSFFGEGKVKNFWPNNQNRKNRQHYLDVIQSKHFTEGVTCNTCHSACNATAGRNLRMAKEELCVSCHNKNGAAKRPNREMFTGSSMQEAGVECVDCHMPRIVYGAAGSEVMKQHWDRRAHTFKAITPEYKDRWGMRTACDQCHTQPKKGEAPAIIEAYDSLNTEESSQALSSNQQTIREKISKAQQALVAAEKGLVGKSGPGAVSAREQLAQAQRNVDFVLLDGSWGFHNFSKANDLLDAAIETAATAGNGK